MYAVALKFAMHYLCGRLLLHRTLFVALPAFLPLRGELLNLAIQPPGGLSRSYVSMFGIVS